MLRFRRMAVWRLITPIYLPTKTIQGHPKSTQIFISPLNDFNSRLYVGDGVDASWSPDGRHLIWVSQEKGCGGDDILQADLNLSDPAHPTLDGTAIRLTCDGFRKRHVHWSARNEIVFSLSTRIDAQENMRLVKFPANAHDTKTFTTLVPGIFPNWSPDGSKIVYATGKIDATDAQIWVVNSDGKGNHPLTTIADGWNYRPQWLPSGLILFSSNRERGGQNSTSLWVMNGDGSQPQKLPIAGEDDNYAIWGWFKP